MNHYILSLEQVSKNQALASASQPDSSNASVPGGAALDRVNEAIQRFDTDVQVTDGVARWKSTGHVPPSLFLDLWTHVGKSFDNEKSVDARVGEVQKFLSATGEINKRLGEYLGNYISARYPLFFEDAEGMINKFDNESEVVDGIVRWKSNKSIPPVDILQIWAFCEKPFDYSASEIQRQVEVRDFLEQYRAQEAQNPVSEEQIAMARGAHGSGVTLVNAITGRKFTT